MKKPGRSPNSKKKGPWLRSGSSRVVLQSTRRTPPRAYGVPVMVLESLNQPGNPG